MKIIHFMLTLLAIGASATDKNASIESLSNMPATSSVSFLEYQGRHQMIIDEQCILDTNLLYNNPILAIAHTRWEAQLGSQDLSDRICTVLDNKNNKFACTLDSKLLFTTAHDDVVTACQMAGGMTYLQKNDVYCKIQDYPAQYEFHIGFQNAPQCLASSCKNDEAQELLLSNNFADKAAKQYEATLSFIFARVECSGSRGLSWKVTLGGIAGALVWTLCVL